MKTLSEFITYLNLLASTHGLTIDWNTSDIDKKQLNFIGGTDEQIWNFCIELEKYCGGEIE